MYYMLFIDKVKDFVGPISTPVSKLCKLFKNFIIVYSL